MSYFADLAAGLSAADVEDMRRDGLEPDARLFPTLPIANLLMAEACDCLSCLPRPTAPTVTLDDADDLDW